MHVREIREASRSELSTLERFKNQSLQSLQSHLRACRKENPDYRRRSSAKNLITKSRRGRQTDRERERERERERRQPRLLLEKIPLRLQHPIAGTYIQLCLRSIHVLHVARRGNARRETRRENSHTLDGILVRRSCRASNATRASEYPADDDEAFAKMARE